MLGGRVRWFSSLMGSYRIASANGFTTEAKNAQRTPETIKVPPMAKEEEHQDIQGWYSLAWLLNFVFPAGLELAITLIP